MISGGVIPLCVYRSKEEGFIYIHISLRTPTPHHLSPSTLTPGEGHSRGKPEEHQGLQST